MVVVLSSKQWDKYLSNTGKQHLFSGSRLS